MFHDDNHLYNYYISISYYILTAMDSRRFVHQRISNLIEGCIHPQNKWPDLQGQNGWVGGCRFHISSLHRIFTHGPTRYTESCHWAVWRPKKNCPLLKCIRWNPSFIYTTQIHMNLAGPTISRALSAAEMDHRNERFIHASWKVICLVPRKVLPVIQDSCQYSPICICIRIYTLFIYIVYIFFCYLIYTYISTYL